MNIGAIYTNVMRVAKEIIHQSNDSRRWKLARWVFELYILNLLVFVLLFFSLDFQSFSSIASAYLTVVIGGWTAVVGIVAGFYYKTYDKISSEPSSPSSKTETVSIP